MKWHSVTPILWMALIMAMLVAVGCTQPAGPLASPGEVVQAFYRWYLGYPGNVMVDRAYRDSEHLSSELKAEVDAILDSFSMGGYDPFLMAQDIPAEMAVGSVTVEGDRAVAAVEQRWSGGVSRDLTVELEQIDGHWLINRIIPPEMDSSAAAPQCQASAAAAPEAVVREFYGWYLDYIGDRENPNNPLVDGAFRQSASLAPELITQVDEILASFGSGGYDPFLCAQDIPDSITVGEPRLAASGATVPVRTSFPGHGFDVVLRVAQDGWRIAAIDCTAVAPVPSATEPAPVENTAVPAGWQQLQDQAYGFEISYPFDWSVVEIPLRNPELDAPLVRVVQILPSEWAAKMNLGGPPDPNNSVVAPLSLEVSMGSLEQYRRQYYEMPLIQETEINGSKVIIEQDEPGDYQVSRYVFQHPLNDDLRITVVDLISGFAERAVGNESIVETMNQILATFSFTG